MIERTALKILPIMKELGNRLAGINGMKGLQAFHHSATSELRTGDAGAGDEAKDKLRDDVARKLKTKSRGMVLGADDEELKDELSGLDPSVPKSDIQDASIEVKNEQEQ